MPNPNEAREQAWDEIYHHADDYDAQDCLEADVTALLNIEREEDEKRIAALVPTEATCFCDEAYTKRGLQDHACHYHHYDWLWDELRALAGQSEGVENA